MGPAFYMFTPASDAGSILICGYAGLTPRPFVACAVVRGIAHNLAIHTEILTKAH
jgi:hypothetical protein